MFSMIPHYYIILQLIMMNPTTKSGLDFQDLARGGERNYSCSFLVNLDADLMTLTNPRGNFLDLSRDVLIAHTERIVEQICSRWAMAGIINCLPINSVMNTA